jgi:hypothetical protein
VTYLNAKLPVAINVIRLSPDGRHLFTLDDHGRILQIDLIDPSKCYTWASNFKEISEGGYDSESSLDILDYEAEIHPPVTRYLVSKCKDMGDIKAGRYLRMSWIRNL